MAEVMRVLGKMQLDTEGGSVKMQLDTEGGVVQVSYKMRDKIIGSFAGEIGVTKAELGNEEVTSRLTREIGVTKAELPKEATRSFTHEISSSSTPEIGVTKAATVSSTPEIGVKPAAVSSTPEIGVTKVWRNKEAGSSIGCIGVTKAELPKEATRSSTCRIVVTKAEHLNKKATDSFNPEIGVTKASAGSVTKEVSGSFSGADIGVTKALLDKYLIRTGVAAAPDIKAWLYKFAEGSVKVKSREERKAETVVVPMMKERVPDAYIENIKSHPLRKMSPLKDSIARGNPKLREFLLSTNADIDYLVDLEQDCLRQYEEKGYAEIGVDYTDGFKKVFILPNPVVEVEGK